MTISRWKGFKPIIEKKKNEKLRTLVITPSLIGTVLHLHNGRQLIPILIKNEYLGSKLGELVPTKIRAVFPRKK